ncbi:hypothetical protein PHMEG_00034696 [Phytophthora megakarya]|uniref:Cleavage induced protein n=2 Tax=Phytophthora megakarya TaxID=4795 RepID=A0A225UT43_9STRA|nr:hypothetical protein PHMEG_00034696 [Phytophthora megakarya]
MKFLSRAGCTGDGEGGCFVSKRAHFRPSQLPDVVKAFIAEKYQGLAAAYPNPPHSRTGLDSTLRTLRRLDKASVADTHRSLSEFAYQFGLTSPGPSPDTSGIDTTHIRFLSNLALRSQLQLPAFVRLIRGQTEADPRPNKSLHELKVPPASRYRQLYCRWNDIVRHEVRPQWRASKPQLQGTRPTNHHIPVIHLDKVRKHIRKGQLERRYLALDKEVLDFWPEVFISPAGQVDKGETDKRVINDYSFPHGESVNDFTDTTDFPPISYNPPRDIATRIHDLRTKYPNVEVLIMLGDVSGAFRHVPDNELGVHAFAFLFDGYIVIDLACGFGWCGPPAVHAIAGTLINHHYEISRPTGVSLLDASTFTSNVWCDDHVCVEVTLDRDAMKRISRYDVL